MFRVFWLLSWLFTVLSGCCLGYSPCLWLLSWLLSMSLVVVMVTLHVSGCCLGYSPCLWLLSWLFSMSLVVVLVILHVSEYWCQRFGFYFLLRRIPILLLTSSSVPPLSFTTLLRQINMLSSSLPLSCTLPCFLLFKFNTFLPCIYPHTHLSPYPFIPIPIYPHTRSVCTTTEAAV